MVQNFEGRKFSEIQIILEGSQKLNCIFNREPLESRENKKKNKKNKRLFPRRKDK